MSRYAFPQSSYAPQEPVYTIAQERAEWQDLAARDFAEHEFLGEQPDSIESGALTYTDSLEAMLGEGLVDEAPPSDPCWGYLRDACTRCGSTAPSYADICEECLLDNYETQALDRESREYADFVAETAEQYRVVASIREIEIPADVAPHVAESVHERIYRMRLQMHRRAALLDEMNVVRANTGLCRRWIGETARAAFGKQYARGR